MPSDTDRIEKQIVLKAAPDRVWRAVSTSKEFGAWFGVRLNGEFSPGAKLRGQVTTPGYDHLAFDMYVDTMEPKRLFSFRWHPHAMDPNRDYSKDTTTLVEFRLEPAGQGTKLTIIESGFDQLPEALRLECFRRNDGGWTAQVQNIERHVSAS